MNASGGADEVLVSAQGRHGYKQRQHKTPYAMRSGY
jgi:hypothetical protein